MKKKIVMTVRVSCLVFMLLLLSAGTLAHAAPVAYAHQVGFGSSYFGPSVQGTCNNNQYYAYVDVHDNVNIYNVTTSVNYVTNQYSVQTPALTCWHNQQDGSTNLVVAWRSLQGRDIFLGPFTGTDIVSIYEHREATTNEAPTLTSDGSTGLMELGWVGTDHHLNLEFTTLTSNSRVITFTDYTHPGGGLTFYAVPGTLWVTWSASDPSNAIWLGHTSTTSPSKQLTDVSFSDSSYYAPGIYANNGTVDFIWLGSTNEHLYTGHWNGVWHGSHQQSDTSFNAPAMDGNGGAPITAFTGTNNVVYFDGPGTYVY